MEIPKVAEKLRAAAKCHVNKTDCMQCPYGEDQVPSCYYGAMMWDLLTLLDWVDTVLAEEDDGK